MTRSARELIAELSELNADTIYDELQKIERQIEDLEDEAKAMRVLLKVARTRKGQSDTGKKSGRIPRRSREPSSEERKSQIVKLLSERGPLPYTTIAHELGYSRPGFMRNHLKDRRFVWDEQTDTVRLRTSTQSPI